jgi:hypothetical protein
VKKTLAAVLAILLAAPLAALDFWQWPEAADKNALFLDARFAGVSFTDGFQVFPPAFSLDYILPVVAPFSLGAYFKTPEPNLKSFGVRLGYHINLDEPNTDLYGLYVFDFGFTRNALLAQYDDEQQPVNWYDFRVGIRRRFRSLCICLETDFKLQGIHIGLALKIN